MQDTSSNDLKFDHDDFFIEFLSNFEKYDLKNPQTIQTLKTKYQLYLNLKREKEGVTEQFSLALQEKNAEELKELINNYGHLITTNSCHLTQWSKTTFNNSSLGKRVFDFILKQGCYPHDLQKRGDLLWRIFIKFYHSMEYYAVHVVLLELNRMDYTPPIFDAKDLLWYFSTYCYCFTIDVSVKSEFDMDQSNFAKNLVQLLARREHLGDNHIIWSAFEMLTVYTRAHQIAKTLKALLQYPPHVLLLEGYIGTEYWSVIKCYKSVILDGEILASLNESVTAALFRLSEYKQYKNDTVTKLFENLYPTLNFSHIIIIINEYSHSAP